MPNNEKSRPDAPNVETANSKSSPEVSVSVAAATSVLDSNVGGWTKFAAADLHALAVSRVLGPEASVALWLLSRAVGHSTELADDFVTADVAGAREDLGANWKSRGLAPLLACKFCEMGEDGAVRIPTGVAVVFMDKFDRANRLSNREYFIGIRNNAESKDWLKDRRRDGLGDQAFVALSLMSWSREDDGANVARVPVDYWKRCGLTVTNRQKDGKTYPRCRYVEEASRRMAVGGMVTHSGSSKVAMKRPDGFEKVVIAKRPTVRPAMSKRKADAPEAPSVPVVAPEVDDETTTPEVVAPEVDDETTTPEVVAPEVDDETTTPEVVAPEVDDETTTPEADYIPTDEPAEVQADDDTTGQPKAVLSDDADAVPASEPNTDPEPKEAVITEKYTASVARETTETGNVVTTITGSGDWRRPAPVNRGVVETPPRAVVFPSDAPDWDERVAALNARTARELAEGKIIADAVRQAIHGDRFIPAT